jgi:DNA-binding NtrC family response regulator
VRQSLNNYIGVSAASQAVRAELEDAAAGDAKVLITGESGVGKEVASNVIHQLSRRAQMPFVAINCVGIPESLLESELFGHAKGSFTGAYRDRVGLIERAHRGTLFLDEVCEMGPRMQGLLLRFLETGDIEPVGSERGPAQVDVRIIAATNRDPMELVRNKTFREDLYYRLNVIEIEIPPLRERREDIPVLFAHFLQIYCAQRRIPAPVLAPDAVAWLLENDWPGNVRQLRNTAERLALRGRGEVVTAAHFAPRKEMASAAAPVVVGTPDAPAKALADAVYDRMVKNRESFWSAVHAAYMVRDLTRKDVRAIITRGLHETAGNYKMLVELFNMDRSDYKRFLNFLRKHECQLPFADFRAVRSWHRDVSDPQLRSARASSAMPVRH